MVNDAGSISVPAINGFTENEEGKICTSCQFQFSNVTNTSNLTHLSLSQKLDNNVNRINRKSSYTNAMLRCKVSLLERDALSALRNTRKRQRRKMQKENAKDNFKRNNKD